ncbi:hypothetical protein DFH11DRAFT_1594672 [Phellopilus nigrolimitatus]|nr:hypothetical protein DFH11DRAFT_1594672 [Phellopilus nigrolimitatus]
MPSEVYSSQNSGAAQPPAVGTPPQQGAPEPGSGTTVHEDQVPFKDQVFGYAKTIRGSVLRKPETKATGEKILHGDMSAKDYFEQKRQ